MLLHISGLLIYACILSACIHGSVPQSEQEYEICFDIATGSLTKSAEDPAMHQLDDPIKVWAVLHNDVEENRFIIDGEVAHYREGLWRTETQHIWPDSSILSFNVFSPADADAAFSIDQGGISFGGLNSKVNCSFKCTMLTERQRKPDTEGPVSLFLYSPFSRLEFRAFSSDVDDVDIYVTRITLMGLFTTGDFTSSPEFTWSGLRNPEDLVVFEGRTLLSEYAVNLGDGIPIIPQNLQIKVEYEYSSDSNEGIRYGEYTVSSGNALKPETSRLRTYILKISTDFVGIQKPEKYEE
jgi:hypothetical protein